MNKAATCKDKYCIQWAVNENASMRGLCTLIENQSLVDVAICCGNNTLHAHKCVLAANSPLFKEEFERNALVEQVIINGCDFAVMKSILEVMYSGETIISEEYIKYFVAVTKLLQMDWIRDLFADYVAEEVNLPPPQFLTRKPKYYSTACTPILPNLYAKPLHLEPAVRFKRSKAIKIDAEKACMKEATASRVALVNLQKEINGDPQAASFLIEEGCTEATLENFISHGGESFANYPEAENLIKPSVDNLTADKIKQILNHEVPENVELMFKTNDGKYVSVTEEVLENISKGGLQYQVVDENGQVGEVRELQMEAKTAEKSDADSDEKMEGTEYFFVPKSGDLMTVSENVFGSSNSQPDKLPLKFSPDIFFADMPSLGSEEKRCDQSSDVIQVD